MNLPNKLTLIRICMIPLFAVIYFIPQIPYNFLISAIIFALAAFTDFLDGYIARKYNLVTDLGKFLDPIADKVLVSTAFILMLSIMPNYSSIGVAVILARELIVSGFRLVAAGKGVVLSADWSGKIKTFTQDVCIVVLLIGVQFAVEFIFITGIVLFWISVALTVVSGIECIVKNRAVLKG